MLLRVDMQPQAAAQTGLVQQAWRPIHRLLLQIWRLLPLWLRSRLRGPQQRQPPAVHASPIVAQHIMAVIRSQAVEGSTYDLETGPALLSLHWEASSSQHHHSCSS